MKKIIIYLLQLVLLLCLGSCEEAWFKKGERFPVQGRWKIHKITIKLSNGRDSLVTADMGYIVFGRCQKADNNKGACTTGVRVYPSGASGTFYFWTFWAEVEREKCLVIYSGKTNIGDDLFGNYVINVLNKNNLVFSCKRCFVGPDADAKVFEYFELRATRE